MHLLTDEQLSNCPVLILGNKIDIPESAGMCIIILPFSILNIYTFKAPLESHKGPKDSLPLYFP